MSPIKKTESWTTLVQFAINRSGSDHHRGTYSDMEALNEADRAYHSDALRQALAERGAWLGQRQADAEPQERPGVQRLPLSL